MSDAVSSVVAIDIGTHKIAVLIGKVHAPDNIEVVGMATARNRGMSKGKIVSLDKVISAIKMQYPRLKIWLNAVSIQHGSLFQVLI